jgi:DNA recombination protein RmuC
VQIIKRIKVEIIGFVGGFFLGSLIIWLILKGTAGKSTLILNNRIDEQGKENDALLQDIESERTKVLGLSNEVATLTETNKNLTSRQAENEKMLIEKFENLANDILDKKSQKFTDQNEKNLGNILGPLKEKIDRFEAKVEKTNKDSLQWNTALKTQIEGLAELNKRINKEAENLTKALKGETKTQGNWGEFILESILEKSGLMKDREYFVQESMTSEEGRRFQPDVIVKLPEDKHVIIDAKVALVAYERFVSSEDEEERKAQLTLHVQAVRRHIKQLSEKEYQKLREQEGLDFVLLFIPIEPAFSLALQFDNDIFIDALDKNIVIVSPTTLIATLRTIASIWKNEYQSRNAIEIARQSGNLYDKFVGFTNDLLKVGRSMDTAKDTYEEAMNKLTTGKGNLVSRVDNIQKLGAKTSKALDDKLVDRAGSFIEEKLEGNNGDNT